MSVPTAAPSTTYDRLTERSGRLKVSLESVSRVAGAHHPARIAAQMQLAAARAELAGADALAAAPLLTADHLVPSQERRQLADLQDLPLSA